MLETITCPGCDRGKVRLIDLERSGRARCTRGCEVETDSGSRRNLRQVRQAGDDLDRAIGRLGRTIGGR